MGVIGFYPWLSKMGYVPKKAHLNCKTDTLLIDAKAYMYRYLYGLDPNETNEKLIVDQLVDHIAHSLSTFPAEHVTFCNDGVLKISGMKSKTLIGRQETRERAQKKVKLLEDEHKKLQNEKKQDSKNVEDEEVRQIKQQEIINLETKIQQARKNARHVSTECSMQVLEGLKQRGFQTIQCEGEADVELAEFSSRYTYVLADDADLLVRGVNNLLRDFNKENRLYNAFDIRKQFKISSYQLKTIVCLAGCDYVDGIAKMGVKTAYDYVVKHVHFENTWKEIAKKFTVTQEQREEIEKAILEF